MSGHEKLLRSVADYYSEKINEHGISAKGVDWNSESSQELRFEVLLKAVNETGYFSILDYGCGYGALLGFLKGRFPDFDYTGFDISEEMLVQAVSVVPESKGVKWISAQGNNKYDYTVASGIFNVKLELEKKEWEEYILATLKDMDDHSTKGFSFNMLTAYSDKAYMRDYLYYADPAYYFDFCKKHFSKYVALLHDYPLYEFTIVVNKEL